MELSVGPSVRAPGCETSWTVFTGSTGVMKTKMREAKLPEPEGYTTKLGYIVGSMWDSSPWLVTKVPY